MTFRSVMIVRSAIGDAYEPAWKRALSDLGLDCYLFETRPYLSGYWGRIQERVLWGPGLQAANRALVATVKDHRPDVVVFYQGHHFPAKTLKEIKRYTFVVGVHNDDPTGPHRGMLRYRHLLKALPEYQGYHVYRECNIPEFKAEGVQRVKVLMPYYLPWSDYPRDLSDDDRATWGSDIAFAGHPEPGERIECISRATRSGIGVRIYGDGRFWNRWLPRDVYEMLRPIVPAYGEAYRKLICGSKISCCFLSRWNRDVYTRRVFEIPACGGFLLCERTKVMTQLYKEDVEAAFFDGAEEFMDKVLYYLKHDNVRTRIARAGNRRAVSSGYDVYTRMRQWIQDVNDWRNDLIKAAEGTP